MSIKGLTSENVVELEQNLLKAIDNVFKKDKSKFPKNMEPNILITVFTQYTKNTIDQLIDEGKHDEINDMLLLQIKILRDVLNATIECRERGNIKTLYLSTRR